VIPGIITLLVEELGPLARAAPNKDRYPVLERIMARGSRCQAPAATANHLRFALFGIEQAGDLPVAALTHVNDRGAGSPQNDYYWLRADPVTMWADMTRVFMTSYGFADLDPHERNEIENCVRSVLREEGIVLHADHAERWCIALEHPLEFEFTALDQALGMDVAEALPEHPGARYWRRLLNEIQVALHHSPVNVRRRHRGQQEINSVWFWGGGFIPDAAPHDLFDTVYADHPVSSGLALINDCRLRPQRAAEEARFDDDGRNILIDWLVDSRDARHELQCLDWVARPILDRVDSGKSALTLFDGSGAGWIYDRSAKRRFWRRRRPLPQSMITPAGS
jgi:hypothetical protein